MLTAPLVSPLTSCHLLLFRWNGEGFVEGDDVVVGLLAGRAGGLDPYGADCDELLDVRDDAAAAHTELLGQRGVARDDPLVVPVPAVEPAVGGDGLERDAGLVQPQGNAAVLRLGAAPGQVLDHGVSLKATAARAMTETASTPVKSNHS